MEALFNENQLLRRTAAGDEQAFRSLFEQYADAIYGVAFCYTKSATAAEELVQDIFVKVWQKREALPALDRFDNYLFIISRNHILNYFRTQKRRRLFHIRVLQHFRETETRNPETDLLFKESQWLIDRAVRELPVQQQRVYELRRERGMSLDEVARQMGISRNTARNHLNQALKNMRKYLEMYSDGVVFLLCASCLFL